MARLSDCTVPAVRGLFAAIGLVCLLTACQPIASGLGGSGAGVADPSFPPVLPEDLPADDQDAVELTEALLTGRYADVVARFNAPMRDALSEREVGETTEELLDALGGVSTVGQPGSVVHDGALVYLVPVSLTEGFAHVRITFDGDGRVAGLYLLR